MADRGIREAERLLGSRREWRASIPIVETSSHLGVNIDQAFLMLAQMIERSKSRVKVLKVNSNHIFFVIDIGITYYNFSFRVIKKHLE